MPTEHNTTAPDPRLIWVGLAILYGVWGSTYLAIAVGVQTIPRFGWPDPPHLGRRSRARDDQAPDAPRAS
jgi:hypothetical protein